LPLKLNALSITNMLNHSLTLVFIITLAFLSFQKSSLASDLVWDQTSVEIEMEPHETEAKAQFVVTNNSDETVVIDRVKTSCGCTGSILKKSKIEPGESTTIVGTFNKKNREGLSHNRLQVFLKDQPDPVETLQMIVQVPKLIDASPSFVYWNQSSTQTERQVRIKLDTNYLNEISSIEYDAELISVTEKKDTGDQFDRILVILPKTFDQQLRQSILIKAKGPNDLTAEKRLQVFVQP